MTSRFRGFLPVLLLCVFVVQLAGIPALADHPGHKLDEVMGSKEKYFQVIDKPAPAFSLQDADGRAVTLDDMRDKIVVLHFVYTGCPDICPLHAERIAEIQEMVAQTSMNIRVQFVTITTDPENDTAEVMKDYGPAHGLERDNWIFLTKRSEQAEDDTRKLAEKFGHKFIKSESGYQTHSSVTHIIDRGGRWAANFHGLKFRPVNLVLYLNGLSHNTHRSEDSAETSFWQRLREWF